jgi:redox-sensitive bicupin YhaK (pirin superfamily)
MFGVESGAAFHCPVGRHGATSVTGPRTGARALVLLASGPRYGAITRLIAPWNIAELTRPFVFLDYAEVAAHSPPLLAIQPPASIATLTLVLNGALSFKDASGGLGKIRAGGFAWMNAAHADWRGSTASDEPLRVLQLWISLAALRHSSPAVSEVVTAQEVQQQGPVSVILGQFGRARSPLRDAPAGINCFRVTLRDGQRWHYAAPDGHNVTWLAVERGGLQLRVGGRVDCQQLAVFGDSGGVIEAQAQGDTSFVLGSASRQSGALAPNEPALAASVAALVQAEAQPQWIAPPLRAQDHR